jgi:hypothetical protein
MVEKHKENLISYRGHRRLKDAQTLAHAALHPVAVLLSRELMWED